MELRIALIGFGVVGQGFAMVLSEQGSWLKKEHDLTLKLVAISDIQKGSVYNPDGLDIDLLLELVSKNGNIEDYPGGVKDLDGLRTIIDTNADVIVEVTWSNIETGEPALSYARKALESGKHLVLTNKGPPALALNDLATIARENRVQLRYEGTVLSGTPAINLGIHNLAGSGITAFKGIVNGTTNFILTLMEEGLDYDTAVKRAQDEGYAEADPSFDVDGHDALSKVVILANTLFGCKLKPSDVSCKGIRGMSIEEIMRAKREEMRWKLIASAELQSDGNVIAEVKPQKIPLSNPLASVWV